MVLCPKCGNENKDAAKFCVKCGSLLASTGELSRPSLARKGKSPIIAFFASFLWGLGHYYIGIKKVYGLPWYLLLIIFFIAAAVLPYFQYWGVFISFAIAYDAYQKALGRPGWMTTE